MSETRQIEYWRAEAQKLRRRLDVCAPLAETMLAEDLVAGRTDLQSVKNLLGDMSAVSRVRRLASHMAPPMRFEIVPTGEDPCPS